MKQPDMMDSRWAVETSMLADGTSWIVPEGKSANGGVWLPFLMLRNSEEVANHVVELHNGWLEKKDGNPGTDPDEQA